MAGAQAHSSRLAVAAVRRAARFTPGVVGAHGRRLNPVDQKRHAVTHNRAGFAVLRVVLPLCVARAMRE
jgi:hypothetical protein